VAFATRRNWNPYDVTHTHFAIVGAWRSDLIEWSYATAEFAFRMCLEFHLRLRALASELDFEAKGICEFKQSLKLLPFAARNALGRIVRIGLQ
jgi:hypothetical protein